MGLIDINAEQISRPSSDAFCLRCNTAPDKDLHTDVIEFWREGRKDNYWTGILPHYNFKKMLPAQQPWFASVPQSLQL